MHEQSPPREPYSRATRGRRARERHVYMRTCTPIVFSPRPENNACTARSLDLQHLDFCAVRNDGPRTERQRVGGGGCMCCGGLISLCTSPRTKVEAAVGRDAPRREAVGAVALIGRDRQLAHLADLHA